MNVEQHAPIFFQRRQHFMKELAPGIAVIPAGPVSVRSNDVEYPYRQDSDFHYLTGFDEPEAVAVFAPGREAGAFILFVRPRDKEREIWTGRRAGVEGALARYGADQAYPIDELEKILPPLLEKVERVWYPLNANQAMDKRMMEWLHHCQLTRPRSGSGAVAMLDPREISHEMRLFKDPAELETMAQAAAISAQAHRAAMAGARGGMMEWQVEALIDYTFRAAGAAGPSYPSIIASGDNATVLHYTANDREIRQGDLILIDAGCEYRYYASDITRTFPANARFNPIQRDLYQLVLDAQLRAIEAVAPGVALDDLHEIAVKVLIDGLLRLKLLEGSAEEVLASGSYRRFYMHRTSHWLGIDVHDVGLYRKGGAPRKLEPGMVLTVEPGLYIAADDDQVAEHFRGIGIRIEDDVLVTEGGHQVITAATPKSIEEIEALTAAA